MRFLCFEIRSSCSDTIHVSGHLDVFGDCLYLYQTVQTADPNEILHFRADEMLYYAVLCGISSGSSLFAKVSLYGYPE